VAKKGFVNLIGATARLHAENSRVRLALGGKGDLAEALATRARDEGCAEVVCLLGDVPHDEVGALLGAADVVVVPSIRDDRGNVDGLPNVLLESMAAGRPVIASRVGGIPDVIESERNGLLVEPGDVDALAVAIRRLRESAALRIALGAGAAATARSLSWPAYGERLLAGYRRAISGKPS
jgi:glycosyltransferase involved in cell wall biosynthesis